MVSSCHVSLSAVVQSNSEVTPGLVSKKEVGGGCGHAVVLCPLLRHMSLFVIMSCVVIHCCVRSLLLFAIIVVHHLLLAVAVGGGYGLLVLIIGK